MKIVLLTDEFPPEGTGGDADVVASLARRYAQEGHSVSIIAPAYAREMAGKTTWEGLPIERIYSKFRPRIWVYLALWRPIVTRKVKRALSELKPDIVHAHGVHGYLSYYSLVLAHQSGAQVYITAHDAMLYAVGKADDESKISEVHIAKRLGFRYNPFYKPIVRYILRRYVAGILAVSESLARALRANGIPVARVIHNGIDVARWQSDPKDIADFKDKYGMQDKTILFGGRVSGRKGTFVLLDAVKKVLEEIPEAQLCIIGGRNENTAKFADHARAAGIEDRIIFTGHLKGIELRAAFNAAAVVTTPSLYMEPFGMMALQAMACAKPVVGGNKGGIPEIIRDGETGFIIDPRDTEQFSEKLALLLKDAYLSKKMGESGRIRATKFFSLELQSDTYLNVFLNSEK